MNQVAIKALLILLIGLGSTAVTAASFDCSKASIPFEFTVCENQTLSSLDDKMSATYMAARRNSPNNLTQLRSDQLTWIVNARTCGSNVSCIENSYKKRISELGGAQSNASVVDRAAEPQQDALAYISKYLWGGGSAGGCTMQNALLVSYNPVRGEVVSQNGKIIISGGKAVGSTQRAEYVYQNKTDQAFTYQGIVYAEGNATVLAAGAKPGTVISDLTDTVTLISKDQIKINRSMINIDTGILFDQRRVQYKQRTNKIEILSRCN